jgi:TRAP transporter TAXI family solute receptor
MTHADVRCEMKYISAMVAVTLAVIFGCGAGMSRAAGPTPVVMGTATPGGGFELYGGVLAEVINSADETLLVLPRNTRGSRQNIPLLEQGTLDVGLVASLPAHEAFAGINRDEPTSLKIITAIYPTFGAFAVSADSPARTFDDLIGKKVAWGTASSGLTLLAGYVTSALGLDRDTDFEPVYLEQAGRGAPMVLNGEVAALWGGGVGWPNFTTIMEAGGRLVGLSGDQIDTINRTYPFLRPMTIPPNSYLGQEQPLETVGSFSFLLARADLPEELGYRLARAIHEAQPELAARLMQGRDTLPENTWDAAGDVDRIHPGARRYLAEIGLQ